jgi:hypothetical protein
MPQLVTPRPHVEHPWALVFALALVLLIALALMLAPPAHA